MRVLSGIQPSGSGELHIGNYLGAVRQWIDLQEENDVFYMLVDLHALTVPIEPAILRENLYKMTAMLLALGLDPAKSTLFVQSLVHEHAELTWLLNTITSMGELRRMTQFKDKAGDEMGTETASVGLFDYPVLQAADILLYQADQVPVGDDQKQHLELTRNLAERFNNKYGQTFTIPEFYPAKDAARIMGIDNPTKKMSKSLGADNYVSLLDDAPRIQEKIMKAVTDSENDIRFDMANKPAISNLLTIFAVVSSRSVDELAGSYGTSGYGRFKTDLAEALISFLSPIQERYNQLISDQSALERILRDGSVKAQAVAAEMLDKVKDKMGLLN